jgi:hypothetical protein
VSVNLLIGEISNMEYILIPVVAIMLMASGGVWLIWAASFIYLFESVPYMPVMFGIIIILYLQPHPRPRNILIWVLGIAQVVSIFTAPEYFYFPIANGFGLYAIYKSSKIKDYKYYFKVIHQISFDDAETKILWQDIGKFILKKAPIAIINATIFPGLGYLLALPFQDEIDDQVMNYFDSHDMRDSVKLILALEEKSSRWRGNFAYTVPLAIMYFQDDYFDIYNYFVLINPVRGLFEVFNLFY